MLTCACGAYLRLRCLLAVFSLLCVRSASHSSAAFLAVLLLAAVMRSAAHSSAAHLALLFLVFLCAVVGSASHSSCNCKAGVGGIIPGHVLHSEVLIVCHEVAYI